MYLAGYIFIYGFCGDIKYQVPYYLTVNDPWVLTFRKRGGDILWSPPSADSVEIKLIKSGYKLAERGRQIFLHLKYRYIKFGQVKTKTAGLYCWAISLLKFII